jgi:hypothetical protein
MKQPHGYRDWVDWIGDEYFPRGLRVVLSLLLNADFVDVKRDAATRQPSDALFDLAAQIVPPTSVPVIPSKTLPPQFALRFIERVPREALARSRSFESDVRRAPRTVLKLLEKALDQLAVDARIGGLQFKPLRACGPTWSIRVGRDHRAALRAAGDGWELLRLLPRGRIYDAVCK